FGAVGCHGIGNTLGNGLDLGPFGPRRQRRNHMQAFSARSLDEILQSGVEKALAYFLCRFDDGFPRDSRAGIQVHYDHVRLLDIVETGAPRVDFECPALDDPEQAGQAVDRYDRLVIVLRVERLEDFLRLSPPGMLLEEALASDAVWAAHERQRPVDHER